MKAVIATPSGGRWRFSIIHKQAAGCVRRMPALGSRRRLRY